MFEFDFHISTRPDGNQRGESKVLICFSDRSHLERADLGKLEVRVQNSSLPVCLLLPETSMPTIRHKGQ